MARKGKQSILFENPPCILGYASVAGKEEKEGPLGEYFDKTYSDPYLGEKTWESAESLLQFNAVNTLIEKTKVSTTDIDIMFGGDLINQCTSSYFAARDLKIPFYGIYGACSTMGEGLQLAAMAVSGGFADKVAAVTSSHFYSSEKQFRFPIEYGGQRPPTAQWTVTAAGAILLGKSGGKAKITKITTGKIVDMGICDAGNMGAAMAPAAADTIKTYFNDFNLQPEDFDHIFTGDLGSLGKTLLTTLLEKDYPTFYKIYEDCGCMIYNTEAQDKHCGGSGCGCSASVLAAYILPMMEKEKFKKILFVPTGALMSPLTCQQGESIASVAHAVTIEL